MVIIEIKKHGKGSKLGIADINKLKDCTKGNNLSYELGVFIGILKKEIDVVWIDKNGEETSEKI